MATPNFFETYIPGFTANTGAASRNITQQLTGLPSTAPSRAKAAYFGATSGMPNSGVSNALGYSLYNQDAEAQKQQGFENLLKMLTGYSGTVAPTTGQIQQGEQFDREMDFRESQAAQDRAAAQAQLDARNAPKKYGFKKIGGGAVPGGFKDREWWQ